MTSPRMAVMTSQLWGDWSYVVSSLAAQVEVHRRATIVLPALRRAGDQRLASDQRAMDASILALSRHRDIAVRFGGEGQRKINYSVRENWARYQSPPKT